MQQLVPHPGVLAADGTVHDGGAVSAESLQQVTPNATVPRGKITGGLAATELVVIAGLAKSKSEAFRLIEQGGVTINDRAISDPRGLISEAQALGNRYKVSKGRRNVAVVEIV